MRLADSAFERRQPFVHFVLRQGIPVTFEKSTRRNSDSTDHAQHGGNRRKYVLSVIAGWGYSDLMIEREIHQLRVGILLFDGITALDAVGPMDAFTTARIENDKAEPQGCYTPITIAVTRKEVIAESGLTLRPMTTLAKCPRLDHTHNSWSAGIKGGGVECGGKQMATQQSNDDTPDCDCLHRNIRSRANGYAGWPPCHYSLAFARDVAQQFPALRVEPDALFLKDGQFYTSAGVTAGIDLALAMIEEDFGKAVALAVARELVVHMKRSGGQEQYSEPLRFQVASTNSTTEVASYIQSHLDHDLSVPALAKIAHLSERQFGRQFKSAFRTSPAAFVERVRLDESRRRLCEARCSIAQLAASVGFGSDDAFRRAFERRFGLSPTDYRTRFGTHKRLEVSPSE